MIQNQTNIIRSVSIVGTGSYVPERVVSNEALARVVQTSDEWIRENLGIRERRIGAPGQATSDLAVEAGKRALSMSGLLPADIDLIIVATATPDRPQPSTACLVQAKLRATNAAAFDVSAVCSGFLYGLSVGANMIAAGSYEKVLVVGADMFSRITNWSDRHCVFFGDGAGAVVLSRRPSGDGFLAIDLYANGDGYEEFTVPGGGSERPTTADTVSEELHYFRMNGGAVYHTATKVLPNAIGRLLAKCAIPIDDIEVIIPHQPSIRILRATAEGLGLPFERVLTNMDRYGNTAGASIPILLDEANRAGRLRPGNILVLAAVGAGWTWGAGVLRWEATGNCALGMTECSEVEAADL